MPTYCEACGVIWKLDDANLPSWGKRYIEIGYCPNFPHACKGSGKLTLFSAKDDNVKQEPVVSSDGSDWLPGLC